VVSASEKSLDYIFSEKESGNESQARELADV
jgi:hypothetical protein